MNAVSDDHLRDLLSHSKKYCLVILSAGPNWGQAGADKIIGEHGRRNLQLRADGVMPIMCPLTDEDPIKGIAIFNAPLSETKQVMDGDPAVVAGILQYVVHRCRSFPGDRLPE